MKKVYLSFDLWNTIISPNPEYRIARNNLLSEISGLSLEEVSKIHKDTKADLDIMARNYGVSFSSRACWELLFTRLNTNVEFIDMTIYRFMNMVWEYPPILTPDNFNYLKSLNKKGYEIKILSNTNFISGEILREVVNLWAFSSDQFFSDEHGYAKPDLMFFNNLKFPKSYNNSDIGQDFLSCHFGDDFQCDKIGAGVYGIGFRLVENPSKLIEVVERFLENAL